MRTSSDNFRLTFWVDYGPHRHMSPWFSIISADVRETLSTEAIRRMARDELDITSKGARIYVSADKYHCWVQYAHQGICPDTGLETVI